jgi:hypothetical protein
MPDDLNITTRSSISPLLRRGGLSEGLYLLACTGVTVAPTAGSMTRLSSTDATCQ